jgi:hypothetical protein
MLGRDSGFRLSKTTLNSRDLTFYAYVERSLAEKRPAILITSFLLHIDCVRLIARSSAARVLSVCWVRLDRSGVFGNASSTLSSALEGLAKVLQMLWTHREIAQFHGRGVETLRGLAAKVQDHSSDRRTPSATLALALDANAAQLSKPYSQKTSTQRSVKNLSIRFCSVSVMKAPSHYGSPPWRSTSKVPVSESPAQRLRHSWRQRVCAELLTA